jgi:diguanylate cyclase (GGDEF)-like protein
MDVTMGTDTSASLTDMDRLLAAIRRLTALTDEAVHPETIFRGLAAELMSVPGAEEVHIHHLAGPGEEEDLVAVYMYGAEGRLSYLVPRGERPPGVSWAARSGRSFLAAAPEELEESLPRLAETGAMSCALLLPLADHGEVGAVVVLVRRLSEQFAPNAVELGTVLIDQAVAGLALVRARAEAGTDPVSGCMNHRAMRRRLDEEIGRAMRTGGPLSCMLIDLDNFKLVNDRYGHQAGDAMLRAVVDALVGEFRAFDRVARYGGDEFVVILPNADLDAATAAASRALERLGSLSYLEEIGSGVSASIGVAQWQAPMTTDTLLQACDEALLRAKRQGKGRVTRASEAGR